MNKLKVVVRAPSLTMSGYGVHSRQICDWALSREDFDVRFDLLNWGVNSWYIDEKYFDGLAGKIMQRSTADWDKDAKPEISIQCQLPNEWDPQLAQVNIGVTAAVETDRCNPEWVSNCNQMHAVIVPSQHTADVLTNSGEIRTRIFVIPESFFNECLDEEHSEQSAIDSTLQKMETKFNFLMLGQITANSATMDRKNTFNSLKLFCEVFEGNKDVGLILKTNSGHMTKIDRKVTLGLLRNAMEQIKEVIASAKKVSVKSINLPKVFLLHGLMSQEEIVSLYKSPHVNAMLSLTRGEGYGLPLLEAAACDLPIIVTGWSGHMDFMGRGKFNKVEYNLTKIPDERVDNQIFMEGTQWAEVRYDDAARRIKKIVSSYDVPKGWATALGKEIRENYSQEMIRSLYDKFFNEHLGI